MTSNNHTYIVKTLHADNNFMGIRNESNRKEKMLHCMLAGILITNHNIFKYC